MSRARIGGWIAPLLVAALIAVLAVIGAVAWLNVRGEAPVAMDAAPVPGTAEQVARGRYLATAGNCAGCHTAPGGPAYAGGRPIDTPFGTVYSSNLTPDAASGLGRWSPDHFWRAMHHGRSRDGRLLYPAFPYPNYTHVTRGDSDALYAFLQSLPAVARENNAHTVGFPYNTQAALAVWRALYFRAGAAPEDPARSPEWNRGAYLVQGLGHCNACHSARDALGGSAGAFDLSGGLIPMQNWYAPSLASAAEAGVADWALDDITALLRDGVTHRATVIGPMAEVVLNSTQHLSDADLRAMGVYLQALPQQPVQPPAATARPDERGAALYERHCAACHRADGRGVPGAYPALADNRAVTMDPPANAVRAVLLGGFAPATARNPRPFGMPPFASTLSSDEVAAVLTYVRGSFGNRGTAVTALDVQRYRTQD